MKAESSNMYAFYVSTVTPQGGLGLSKEVDAEEERLLADEVVAAADDMDKIKRPKLTYSLSLLNDIAIVGECNGRHVPKQIWIFSEFPQKVVTHEDVQSVIQIMKKEYPNNPLTLYFE